MKYALLQIADLTQNPFHATRGCHSDLCRDFWPETYLEYKFTQLNLEPRS